MIFEQAIKLYFSNPLNSNFMLDFIIDGYIIIDVV